MLSSTKSRALREGVHCNLTLEDVLIPEVCPVLGIQMKVATGKRGGGDNSPTIDRVRPERGYTKGNVCVISMRANRLKSDGTLEEFQKIVTYLKRR